MFQGKTPQRARECIHAIQGDAIAFYLDARNKQFPRTPLGNPDNIKELSEQVCALVCQDVWVNDVSQWSNVQYTGDCQVTNDTRAEIAQRSTSTIMQSLQSNADVFAAVSNMLGGGTDLEVKTELENRIYTSLTQEVIEQMQSSLNINQIVSILPSNSVYSAGQNQEDMLTCLKTVLVRNNFTQSVTQGTDIDVVLRVNNDENTLQAALDAIQQISDAFARAASQAISGALIAFILVVAFGGIMFFVAIAFQVSTNKTKNPPKRASASKKRST